MVTTLDEQALTQFWRQVSHASDGFVDEAMDAGMQSRETPEFTALATALRRVHPDLLLLVGKPDHPRPEIVVSGGGLKEAIPHVLRAVDAAPDAVRARFDVRAFRPRVLSHQLRVRVKGQDVGVEDIRWHAVQDHRDPSRCDLTLYIPGYIDSLPSGSLANERVCTAVFLLLDHLVGEWAVMTQVGAIDWRSAGPDENPDLSSLPDYLDKIAADD